MGKTEKGGKQQPNYDDCCGKKLKLTDRRIASRKKLIKKKT